MMGYDFPYTVFISSDRSSLRDDALNRYNNKTPSEMDVAPWITHLIFNIYTLDFNKFN